MTARKSHWCIPKKWPSSLGDFTEMFAYQGLQMQEVFGDYSFSNYDVKKSPRMVMIAKKKDLILLPVLIVQQHPPGCFKNG